MSSAVARVLGLILEDTGGILRLPRLVTLHMLGIWRLLRLEY